MATLADLITPVPATPTSASLMGCSPRLKVAPTPPCFASGVSAITAVVSQLKQGDLVLCEENLYGCTVRLFEQVFATLENKSRQARAKSA